MTCERCEELISARLDEPLDPAEEQSLSDHLAQCESCRAFLEAVTAQRRVLQGLPLVAVEDSEVRTEPTVVTPPRFWERRLAIPMPAAALLALVMGIGWWLALRPSGETGVPSPVSVRLARSVEVVRVQPAVARPVEPDKADSIIQKGERSL